MTTYSWKIQLSEFYSDQFKDKGSVEKEKAIEAFQFFPWDKEIDDYKGRDDNPTAPRILFTSSDNRVLDISTINLSGFDLEYTNFATNKYSEFYISNNFNNKNHTIEELIEYFFDNSLEEHIKVKNIPKKIEKPEAIKKEKKQSKNVEFSFKQNHFKALGFLTFMWMGVSIIFVMIDNIEDTKFSILINLFLLLNWLPTFVLHFTYYLKNNKSKVIIDTKNHELTYIKGEKLIKFNRDDIFRTQVTTVDKGKASWRNYSYVWFILKDKRYVTISCLVGDPHEIVETLNCKYEERTRWIPLLP